MTRLEIRSHLDRRVYAVQADEQDLHPQLEGVGPRLDAPVQVLRRPLASVRHDVIDIDADEVTSHFAVGQRFEQFARVDMLIGERAQVVHLVLDRNIDRQQVHRHRLVALRGAARFLRSARHQPRRLLFGVGLGPDQDTILRRVLVVFEANQERLNTVGAKAMHLVDGPGPFEMQAREQSISLPATGRPKRSSKPCSPISTNANEVDSKSTTI